MEEIEVILKHFGDEQSTLLDRYERLSFEVRLNQAILARSLSEPSTTRSKPPLTAAPSLLVTPQVGKKGRRGGGSSAFSKVLKKLLKPILGRKCRVKQEVPDPKDPMSLKALSKSMRF